MYGSEKYRKFPFYANPALLPAFTYTKILNVFLACCVFLTGCNEFTAGTDYYPDWKVYHIRNSGIRYSRVFAIAIDEWNERVCAHGLERELIDSFEKFYIVI